MGRGYEEGREIEGGEGEREGWVKRKGERLRVGRVREGGMG